MMKILYAEDNVMIKDIVENVLIEELGAQVDAVLSGNEAIKLLHFNSSYDVIISDLEMPKGSGLDILRFKISQGLKTPFFFFTNAVMPQIQFPLSEYTLIEKNDFERLKSELHRIHEGLS